MNPNARVVHIESKTTSDSRLKLHDISEINRARFVKKWGRLARGPSDGALGRPGPRPGVGSPRTGGSRHRAAGTRRPVTQFVLYSPYPLVPGGGERMLFELASVFPELVGTANVVFASPQRYSTIRIRQLEATFGFDNVDRHRVAVGRSGADELRFAAVIGNTILPPVPAFGARSVYHIQFPFWVPDRDRRGRMGMARRLRRDLGLLRVRPAQRQRPDPPLRPGGTADPADLGPRHVAGRHRRSPLARTPDHPDRRTLLHRGHNKRQDVVIEAFRRLVDGRPRGVELALGRRHPPEPGGQASLPRDAAVRRGPRLHLLPQRRARRPGRLYERSAVLVHAAGFGVDADEFPEMLEHFGITPIEAASFGCIPVVYGQGGPLDVVRRSAAPPPSTPSTSAPASSPGCCAIPVVPPS